MLRFLLDGQVVNEPIDFDEVSEHLYYSSDLSAYILELDGDITFTGDEYDYLRNLFNVNACQSAVFEVQDDERSMLDFRGIINVSDITFYLDKKYAVCEVQNDNITSRIENNKSIEANLTAGRSKNDFEYSVTTQTVTIYDPTGSNTITREGVRVFDAFKSMISFLTDNQIGFVSDYFDYNTNTSPQVYSVLMTGFQLRTGTHNRITISFRDLFNDLNNLENLALTHENGNIRIEDKEYFKKQSLLVTFENVEDLVQQLAFETLYAKVTFGSAKQLDEDTYLQDIRFNGMRDESYHLGGQCNSDTELLLKNSKIITDTNIIQDVIPSAGGMGGNDNSDYDEDVLIIHCDSSNEVVLTQKPASTTDFYFNDRFTNKEVAQRWLGQIPQSIYAFLGNGNDGCFINLTSDQVDPVPYLEGLQCDQESPLPWNDVNGNYAIDTKYFPGFPVPPADTSATNLMTAGYYTAPANNLYSFQLDVRVEWLSTQFTPSFFMCRMVSDTIDGSREVIESFTSTYEGGNIWRIFGGGSLYLNANDYVGASFIATAPPKRILAGSTFECFDPLGGVWQTYDAASVYQVDNQANYSIPLNDWNTLKANPFNAIRLTYNTGLTDAWLKDISRNVKTGKAELTLLSKNG